MDDEEDTFITLGAACNQVLETLSEKMNCNDNFYLVERTTANLNFRRGNAEEC